MLSMIAAAGWPIWPLICASIIALAIIGERIWSLNRSELAPSGLCAEIEDAVGKGKVNEQMIEALAHHSPLGRVLAAGVRNMNAPREVMKDAIEDAGRVEAYALERYLATLGTIASVSPLLGLLGTVIGMVDIFGALTPQGSSPAILAQGISVALYNTAMGLIVAIPSLIFYRYFRQKVAGIVLDMETQAVRLVEVVHCPQG
ncbi:MAG: MotA/TolQ/ExbB proton channel family protein [Proteobacteria bacterium]|nr:MotA/TolQ/ExbB proton channel family protein [Pseudomonadota bacterium]MDE3208712.1 MotA/TolQ/ExbB proton channel family protein [Pseudomonadota bacterium]